MLHGTPPFQVYYRVQRDNEPPRELSKTFTSSRGELTIQPEQSGHYTFSFLQISDNFYRKVDLKGPSIDQVIHPLAAADFVGGRGGSGKRLISSCAGGTVDVDVELRVSYSLSTWFKLYVLMKPFLGYWALEFRRSSRWT